MMMQQAYAESVKQELTISAAASLTDALTEINKSFEAEHPGLKIYSNFGASGILQKQIEKGSPVDVFISASPKQVDALQTKGLLYNDTRSNILTNEIVLVIPANATYKVEKFDDLTSSDVKWLAIGNPDSVPVGQYSQETLKKLGLWKQIAPKSVYGETVRQVLNYVERGEVSAGIVFVSDLTVSKKVKVAVVATPEMHSPIIYPAAVIKSSPNKELATEFIKYLKNDEAKKVFEKYGFKPVE
jgi:molybdate transport system substrate-binding protein